MLLWWLLFISSQKTNFVATFSTHTYLKGRTLISLRKMHFKEEKKPTAANLWNNNFYIIHQSPRPKKTSFNFWYTDVKIMRCTPGFFFCFFLFKPLSFTIITFYHLLIPPKLFFKQVNDHNHLKCLINNNDGIYFQSRKQTILREV